MNTSTRAATTLSGKDLQAWSLAASAAYGLILRDWSTWLEQYGAATLKGWLLAAEAQPEAYMMHPVVGEVAKTWCVVPE